MALIPVGILGIAAIWGNNLNATSEGYMSKIYTNAMKGIMCVIIMYTIVFGKTIEYLRNNLFEELVIFPHYEGNKKSGFYLKRQLLPEGKSTDLSALYSATFTQKLNEPWKKIYRTDILHNESHQKMIF